MLSKQQGVAESEHNNSITASSEITAISQHLPSNALSSQQDENFRNFFIFVLRVLLVTAFIEGVAGSALEEECAISETQNIEGSFGHYLISYLPHSLQNFFQNSPNSQIYAAIIFGLLFALTEMSGLVTLDPVIGYTLKGIFINSGFFNFKKSEYFATLYSCVGAILGAGLEGYTIYLLDKDKSTELGLLSKLMLLMFVWWFFTYLLSDTSSVKRISDFAESYLFTNSFLHVLTAALVGDVFREFAGFVKSIGKKEYLEITSAPIYTGKRRSEIKKTYRGKAKKEGSQGLLDERDKLIIQKMRNLIQVELNNFSEDFLKDSWQLDDAVPLDEENEERIFSIPISWRTEFLKSLKCYKELKNYCEDITEVEVSENFLLQSMQETLKKFGEVEITDDNLLIVKIKGNIFSNINVSLPTKKDIRDFKLSLIQNTSEYQITLIKNAFREVNDEIKNAYAEIFLVSDPNSPVVFVRRIDEMQEKIIRAEQRIIDHVSDVSAYASLSRDGYDSKKAAKLDSLLNNSKAWLKENQTEITITKFSQLKQKIELLLNDIQQIDFAVREIFKRLKKKLNNLEGKNLKDCFEVKEHCEALKKEVEALKEEVRASLIFYRETMVKKFEPLELEISQELKATYDQMASTDSMINDLCKSILMPTIDRQKLMEKYHPSKLIFEKKEQEQNINQLKWPEKIETWKVNRKTRLENKQAPEVSESNAAGVGSGAANTNVSPSLQTVSDYLSELQELFVELKELNNSKKFISDENYFADVVMLIVAIGEYKQMLDQQQDGLAGRVSDNFKKINGFTVLNAFLSIAARICDAVLDDETQSQLNDPDGYNEEIIKYIVKSLTDEFCDTAIEALKNMIRVISLKEKTSDILSSFSVMFHSISPPPRGKDFVEQSYGSFIPHI